MEKQKIKQREVARIQYYLYCPICKKEITGNAANIVEDNLNKHIIKCRKKKK